MALLFLLPALALLAVVAKVGGVAWVLMWPALCFGTVSLSYLGLGATIFGKRTDGRIPLWSTLFFLPYFLPYRATWWLMRGLKKGPAYFSFGPDLYLGRRPLNGELPPGCSVVVDLTAEFPELLAITQGRRYLSYPTLDLRPPSDATLRAIAEAVAQAEGTVLLHCAQGRGRAATAACVVLLKKRYATTADDAIRKLKRANPNVRLRRRQRAAIARLADAYAEL